MELTKTAEKYVKFAQFCILHKVKPHLIAEAIIACQMIPRVKGFVNQEKARTVARKLIEDAGFRDVRFEKDWPIFLNDVDDVIKLPLESF